MNLRIHPVRGGDHEAESGLVVRPVVVWLM
jgi:hypothetical protein